MPIGEIPKNINISRTFGSKVKPILSIHYFILMINKLVRPDAYNFKSNNLEL